MVAGPGSKLSISEESRKTGKNCMPNVDTLNVLAFT